MQQVDLFENPAGLLRLHDHHHQPRLERAADAFSIISAIPLVTRLPAVFRIFFLAGRLGDVTMRQPIQYRIWLGGGYRSAVVRRRYSLQHN